MIFFKKTTKLGIKKSLGSNTSFDTAFENGLKILMD